MRLEPITEYVAANTSLTEGVNLFTHTMPADVSFGVILVTEGAGNYVDHEVKGVFKGRYQAIIRGTDYDQATDLAYEIFELLNLQEVDMTTYVLTYSRPRHTPIPIGGRSKGDLIELSINFDFRYRTP